MKPLACNYAVVRFLPYPETGEFVNVGLLLACPATGFFDYEIEAKRRARVHDFFPELHRETYAAGLHSITAQLRHYRGRVAAVDPQQYVLLPAGVIAVRHAFGELTRPRESLFRFGPPATVMTADPEAKLKELFEHYVRRQFAQDKEFQEKVMAGRLRKMLTAHRLARFYELGARLGNDDYHVTVPFVQFDPFTHRPVRAIKPLDLDKRGPTEILEHGDLWLARLGRLRDLGFLPGRTLFAVRPPAPEHPRRVDAARRVEAGLRHADAEVVSEEDEAGILAFAREGAGLVGI